MPSNGNGGGCVDTDDLLMACLKRLANGDQTARDRIVELCAERLRYLTHSLLRRYPTVRRIDDTDDVFQGAVMRLHRALGQMASSIESPRALMALGATQIQRELIDLARRHASPSSYAANHGTNAYRTADGERQYVEDAPADEDSLGRWELFHEAVERLGPEQREVFRLVWYLGADQKTIAAVMGCSERTVRTYWQQARNSLKVALGGERPE